MVFQQVLPGRNSVTSYALPYRDTQVSQKSVSHHILIVVSYMNNDPARISAVMLSNLAALEHHFDDLYDFEV